MTRALAASAYVALTLSVLLGMLRSVARVASERVSWVVDELHQFIALLAVVLVAGHLLTLYFDPYLPFSVTNLLLPVNEPYEALPVSLGVFAVYGMALLLLTSWTRRRLSYRFWRGLHYASLVVFALATLHGFFAGSDAAEAWMRGIYAGAASAFAFLCLLRLFARTPTSHVSPQSQR
jgi:predicted ferric reductase